MQYANSGLDVAGPDLPRSLQRTRAALQLELCGMTLDRILANQPKTQLRVLQSSHTHTPLHLPLTPVQHLATQSAALLHQRSKLVTAAASYSPIPAAPPAQAPVLTAAPRRRQVLERLLLLYNSWWKGRLMLLLLLLMLLPLMLLLLLLLLQMMLVVATRYCENR